MPSHELLLFMFRSKATDKRRGREIQKKRQEVRGSMLQKQGVELEERRVSFAASCTTCIVA